MIDGLRGSVEVVNGVDESEMREGLREIPDLPLGLRVVLLGKKADVVPDGK